MKIKISYHIMPWEIDYALLSFTQLKKTSFYLPKDVEIKIDVALNCSNYLIDWNETKLPKQFFIDKFNDLLVLLKDYTVNSIIYEGGDNYGFFDVQKLAYESDVDYYIGLCPDIYFSEHTIPLLIESAKQVTNKHFVITPEIYKMWDNTWDEITNEKYLNVPYEDWNKGDIFKVRYDLKNDTEDVYLSKINKSKWAWWCDLYSKEFYETIARVPDEWIGYGGWDYWSMLISEHIKSKGIDFQQYILKGQTAFEYTIGDLKERGFIKYYKDYFSIKTDAPNQRKIFEQQFSYYLNRQIKLIEKI
jgi:hypothetical protein